jgi:hypothetical protein
MESSLIVERTWLMCFGLAGSGEEPLTVTVSPGSHCPKAQRLQIGPVHYHKNSAVKWM